MISDIDVLELKNLLIQHKLYKGPRSGRIGKVGGSMKRGQQHVEMTEEWFKTVVHATSEVRPERTLAAHRVMVERHIGAKGLDLFDHLLDTYELEIENGFFQSKITSVALLDRTIYLHGDIYQRTGALAGTFSRYFRLDQRGKLFVEHTDLHIAPNYQDTGIGTTFYQHMEQEYIKYGVDFIILEANLTVGGYAWARMGFDFNNVDDQENFVTDFKDLLSDKYSQEVADQAQLEHAWDIAAYIGPDGKQVGKEFLLGTDWEGIKFLTPESEGRSVGDTYFKHKNAKKTA